MAIFHLNIKIVSRGKGASAVARAAYISGGKIKNEYDGRTWNYTNKKGVIQGEILLPENAPDRLKSLIPDADDKTSLMKMRSVLWNEVEKVENKSNSRLARTFEFSLPKELSLEDNMKIARKFARSLCDEGMCVDWCMHTGKTENPHVHILATTRPFDKDGNWASKTVKVYNGDPNRNGERVPLLAKETDTYKAPVIATEYDDESHRILAKDKKGKDIWQRLDAMGQPMWQKTDKEGRRKWKEHKENSSDVGTEWDWDKKTLFNADKTIRQEGKVEEWRARYCGIVNDAIDIENRKRSVSARKTNRLTEEKKEPELIEKVDWRSYKRQGIDKIPTVHVGTANFSKDNDKVSDNEAIKRENEDREKEKNQQEKEVLEGEKDIINRVMNLDTANRFFRYA